MTIGARNISANDALLYRRVDGASLPAWAWRELHTARSHAGDDRSAVLLINDGATPVAMLRYADLERLIDAVPTCSSCAVATGGAEYCESCEVEATR